MSHRRFLPLLTSLFVCSSSPVGAEPTPSWSYRPLFNDIATADGLTGGFTFPNDVFAVASGDAVVPLTPVLAWSVARESTPDEVRSLPYRFSVEVRDDASGDSAVLGFEGTLSGQFWRTGSELSNAFGRDRVQSVELGDREYTLRLSRFDAPTGYGVDGAGAVWAEVRMTAAGGTGGDDGQSPGTVETPEPATLALLGVGVPLFLLARRLRRNG
jgi:hypothetical protein